ncbi:MAG: hypothetical protein HYZ84_01985 [Candidatus Omnitrophica bacterium]|nr:hypothetical protein [Candidatus Omnitrophota bacterium]
MKLRFLFFFSFVSLAFAFQGWEKPVQPAAGDLLSLVPHPLYQGKLLAASPHEIFEETSDGHWKTLWRLHASRDDILRIYGFKEIPDSVFILGTSRVWRFDFRNAEAHEIFRAQNENKHAPLSLAVDENDPDHLFLGTEDGLFESENGGNTWKRSEGFPRFHSVPLVRFFNEQIFAATENRLYVSKEGEDFQPVFSLLSGDAREFLEIEENLFDEENGEEIPQNLSSYDFYELAGSSETDPSFWLATRKGVFQSVDGGLRWRALSQSGLSSIDMRQLAWSNKSQTLFAGTSRGIYSYDFENQRWKEMFEGMARPGAKSLVLIEGKNEVLAAITAEGVMRHALLPDEIKPPPSLWIPSPERSQLFTQLTHLEPTAGKIHKAVMRFANLKNGKIKRWQSESRMAALLPSFSFGRDFSQNNNIDIDRGGTNDADRFITGPSDMDRGWDMDMRWDLGDFIYSSNQTSIDNREKLMVETRNDFLAEATRIYYERRRLQVEIVFAPAEGEQKHYEAILRLEELTSLLDAMTGGWMTRALEKIYGENPQLEKLWQYAPTALPPAGRGEADRMPH